MWVINMAFVRQLIKSVNYPGLCAKRRILLDAEILSDTVGSNEAYAENIFG